MKLQSVILLFWYILIVNTTYTQDTTFLDQNFMKCLPSEATYYQIFYKAKGNWVEENYFAETHQLQGIGYYSSTYRSKPIGSWISYYENEQVQKILNYSNGKLDGQYREFYENGQLQSMGNYSKEKKTGDWHYWYENSQKKLQVEFGEKVKWINFWMDNGVQTLTNGEGYMVEYFNNGEKKFEGRVHNYLATGNWEVFHNNGTKKEIVSFDKNGLASGDHKYWHPNGNLEFWGKREEGLKTGNWQYFDDKGTFIFERIYNPKDKSVYNPMYKPGEREPIQINMYKIQNLIGYPDIALNNGWQGKVIVSVLIDKDGKVENWRILSYRGNQVFKQVVEEQLKLLTFVPAIMNFENTAYWANIPFNFRIR